MSKSNMFLVAAATLVIASLIISFWNPIAAGFFWFTGFPVIVMHLLPTETLKSLTFSPAKLQIELYEAKKEISAKISEANEILEKIRRLELQLCTMVSELMLNRGGEKYIGGYGEQAKFALYRMLRETENISVEPHLSANIEELKRSLCLILIYALIGEERLSKKAHLNIISKLKENDFQKMPTGDELRALARQDGLDVERFGNIIDAYGQFLSGANTIDENVIAGLYALRYRDTSC